MSRWQTQTLTGGVGVPPEERGDCFRACVASILEIPLAELPNPHDNWDAGWYSAMRKRGLQMVEANIEHYFPDGLWIAQVPSLNLPGCMHVVVMQGTDLVHDPAINKKYTDDPALWEAGRGSIQRGWTIGPLDPAITKRALATTSKNGTPNQ